ncbi:MAG: T9SS type A sorting domain-containing protein [Flavobacteriales bacterium]|nr:T9SS type A sorting domain-containing protein [Flavobacteriales bacterium]
MRATLLLLTLAIGTAARAVDVYLNTAIQPFCGYSNGSIHVSVSGGVPPYSFVWSTGATTQNIFDLPPGSYTVTVTDANNDTDEETIDLVDQPDMGPYAGYSSLVDGVGYHPCPGLCNGRLTAVVDYLDGVAPYDVVLQVFGAPMPIAGYDADGNPYFDGLCDGSVAGITVTDANGCMSIGAAAVAGPQSQPADVLGTTDACAGQANGSATLVFPWNGWPGSEMVVRDASEVVVFQDLITPDEGMLVPGLAPGDHIVYQRWPATTPGCEVIVSYFTIGDLGPDCGQVSGSVFVDVDTDCTPGSGDVALASRLVRIQPGDQYTLTDADGAYAATVVYGDHTVEVIAPNLGPLCPLPAPTAFTTNAGTPNAVVDLAMESLVAFDLELLGASGAARPGFGYNLAVHLANYSFTPSGPLTLTLDLDAAVSFTSAVPAATNVAGNTITWDLPELGPYTTSSVYIQAQIPADPGLIGTLLTSTATLGSGLAEDDLGNNTWTLERFVTGSYDPNDKLVDPSDIYLLDQDDHLDYTIRFQNTGTDTAFTVVVVDTLAAELDIASLELGAASHHYTPELDGRVLRFRFDDILLPDSNVNEAASHGFVAFRIKPVAGLLPGTWLRNGAAIYFDFNPPIITPLAEVMADFSTGVPSNTDGAWSLMPNPASDLVRLQVPEPITGAVHVRIISTDGRVVQEGSLQGEHIIDTGALAPGAYVVSVAHTHGHKLLRLIKG